MAWEDHWVFWNLSQTQLNIQAEGERIAGIQRAQLSGGYGVTHPTGASIPVTTDLPSPSVGLLESALSASRGSSSGLAQYPRHVQHFHLTQTTCRRSCHTWRITNWERHQRVSRPQLVWTNVQKNISEGIFQKNILTQGLKTDVQPLGLGCFAATIIAYNKVGPNHFRLELGCMLSLLLYLYCWPWKDVAEGRI